MKSFLTYLLSFFIIFLVKFEFFIYGKVQDCINVKNYEEGSNKIK